MSVTTDHPRARIVALTLSNVADVLLTDWSPKYGIVECLFDVTAHDTYTRIVAERQLQESGVDVFWNDLVCRSAKQASDAVRGVAGRGVDLEALYGPNFEAILGLIEGAVLMGHNEMRALGFQVPFGYASQQYFAAHRYAREAGVERLLDAVESDVHVASIKRAVLTPTALQDHLRGVRALELTSAYYVLKGAKADIPEDFAMLLTQPMRAYVFPREPRL